MTNLAQRMVAAARNSLLVDLTVEFSPLWLWSYSLSLLQSGHGGSSPFASGFVIATGCLLLCLTLACAIGFLSIQQRPKGVWTFERIRQAPRDALTVWTAALPGGPRPPEWIRAVVMTLGRAGRGKVGWLRILLRFVFLGPFVLTLLGQWGALAVVSRALDKSVSVVGLFWIGAAVYVTLAIRVWAVASRERLEAAAQAGP